jgi:hypothetical protein
MKWDIAAEINGFAEWQLLMGSLAESQKIDADREANQAEFFGIIQARAQKQADSK